MTGISDPEFPALQPEAVDLLTAIRDHLDIPLYQAGSKQARREYRNLLEVRHSDVVATLNDLLTVPLADVTDHAAQLRQFAAEETALYRTSDHPNGGA